MEWKKSRISYTRWEANGFQITEDANGEDKPFRLESADADPEWFPSLEIAKSYAALQNELAVTRADNARLRAELAQRNGVWPSGGPVAVFDEDDVPRFDDALDFGEPLEAGIPRDDRRDDRDEDERGIPTALNGRHAN